MNSINPAKESRTQWLIIIVASLGYFVDIYDLILFNVVKKASLEALGFTGDALRSQEIFLYNWQMGGMLLGGILWGILGDKKGRLKVLFGSILLYSAANIANAYVWDISSYATTRFIAGIGLAGELGAGITLITEVMKKEKRGYGTMIVVTFGALGAVAAALIASRFSWQTSYIVGGAMGLILLVMRVGILESGMFKSMHQANVQKGNFFLLFADARRFWKYLKCVAMGLPVWFVVGIPIALTESYFKPFFHLSADITNGEAVMYCYIGLSAGDLLAGLLSQWFRSRIKIVLFYLAFSLICTAIWLFSMEDAGTSGYYIMCLLLGISTGYWGLFVTIAAEQFGTNIRATVASTVPNFVRGAVIPLTLTFKYLADFAGIGVLGATLIVGLVSLGLAIWATLTLEETFSKDLNYYEKTNARGKTQAI